MAVYFAACEGNEWKANKDSKNREHRLLQILLQLRILSATQIHVSAELLPLIVGCRQSCAL